jgi:deoxyribodipyrimidine photolyase
LPSAAFKSSAKFPGIQSDPAAREVPDGVHVRRWSRNFAELPARLIHQPWAATALELTGAGITLGQDLPGAGHRPPGRTRAGAGGLCRGPRKKLITASLSTICESAIVAASTTLGDDMDDDKSILEQATDAMSSAASATTDAAKVVAKKAKKAAKKVAKKVTPKKKAKKSKKAGKKSSAKKSAKKAAKKTTPKKKKKAKKAKR